MQRFIALLQELERADEETTLRVLTAYFRDLPDDARHNIGYRNAWKLLTGEAWSG